MKTPGAAYSGPQSTHVAATSSPGLLIIQGSDAGTTMLSFQPAAYNDTTGLVAGEPAEMRWNVGINPAVLFAGSGARKDRPFHIGYNFGTAGGGTPQAQAQENPSDCCFGLTIEPYYNPSGTTRHVETYLHATPAGKDPALFQVRPFFVTMQWPTLASDTAVECGAEFKVEASLGFGIYSTYDNAGSLTVRGGPAAGTITVTSAHNIVTGTNKNVRWIVGGVYGRRIHTDENPLTIGSVSGTGGGSTVAFSGGEGDDLPAQGSTIEFYDVDSITVSGGTTNNGLDTTMNFTAGAGVVLANNSRSLKQKNSGGTPKDLMFIRDDNYLIVSDFGAPVIYMAGYVQTFGVTTAYVTSSGTMTDTLFKGVSGTAATPADGAVAVTNNGGVRRIWVRAGGAWYSAICA